MRGGSPGFAASNWAVVDDDHRAAGAGQEVCRGHSGNAGADDADVCADVLGERGSSGVSSVAIQTDVVWPESLRIALNYVVMLQDERCESGGYGA